MLPLMLLWTGLMLLLKSLAGASPVHGHRLICWQALIKCRSEPDCNYAYTQYMHACGPVIEGHKNRCPSHCISSIVQLNLTANGPGLENCECAADQLCASAKRAIEPCMPRISHTGCTEARYMCEKDPECSAAMRDYLYHCRELFGGERCTEECRTIIGRMRTLPKARLLDTCECDGQERTICEHVKVSMLNLCFGPRDDRHAGSGFSDDDEEPESDYEAEDYEEQESHAGTLKLRLDLTAILTVLMLTQFLL